MPLNNENAVIQQIHSLIRQAVDVQWGRSLVNNQTPSISVAVVWSGPAFFHHLRVGFPPPTAAVGSLSSSIAPFGP